MSSHGGAGRRRWALALLVIGLLAEASCGGGSKSTGPSTGGGGRTPINFDFGQNDSRRVTAFGDSITRGVLPEGGLTDTNYPNILQAMLRGGDPAWRVVNRGVPGEITADGARRFPGVLAADLPGFALIMEGTNDADRGLDPRSIVANLESMVSTAQGNRTIPILGTIPPIFRNDPSAQSIVSIANGMIRARAGARGVVLAEIFDGMNDPSLFGRPGQDIDPLHPNERGYAVMAGIWFDAIQRALPARSPIIAGQSPAASPPAPATAPTPVTRR